MSNDFLLEEKKLRSTINKMLTVTKNEEESFTTLPKRYKDNPRLLQDLMSISATKIRNLQANIEKPYFARIDFVENNLDKTEICYIGKVGFFGQDSEIIVVDWRAPIASLYYDSNLGQVSYKAPIGLVSGDLKLKRQIIIEDGKLKDIFDVDSVSDDELLKPYLGASADKRLKNIVASIQSEQNSIIRQELYKNIIVQGVAGSGKTTVALHRIAFLVYNYIKTVRSEQFLVIGPNKVFMNYISTVLPDLDAGNVEQLTFEEIAKDFIGEKFEIKDPSAKLAQFVHGLKPQSFLKFKTSLRYKEAIDKFISDIEFKTLLPQRAFIVNNKEIINEKEIRELYRHAGVCSSIEARLNKVSNYIINHAEKNGSLYERDIVEVKKKVKTFMSIKNIKVLGLYKDFINNIEKYCEEDLEMILELKSELFSNKLIDFEDLAALMYIKYRLKGSGKFEYFLHTVIDEAQDFGLFNFFVLKEILKKSKFTVFGDLAQSIYSYRGIDNWEEVDYNIFDGNSELLKLDKSYRTTVEIMDAANKILKHLNLGKAEAVIRHGYDVKISKILNNNVCEEVIKRIDKFKKNNFKSAAIICKTSKEATILYEDVIKKDISLELVTEDNQEYKGGFCILSSNLAKGLEFDAVLIIGVDEKIYDSNNDLDMKLLYVAMTRALHSLEILYEDKVTRPLIDLVK